MLRFPIARPLPPLTDWLTVSPPFCHAPFKVKALTTLIVMGVVRVRLWVWGWVWVNSYPSSNWNAYFCECNKTHMCFQSSCEVLAGELLVIISMWLANKFDFERIFWRLTDCLSVCPTDWLTNRQPASLPARQAHRQKDRRTDSCLAWEACGMFPLTTTCS